MQPCVYFIQAGCRGPIKIGVTVDIDGRLRTLRLAHGKLILDRYLSDTFGVERADDDHMDWVRWAHRQSDQPWRANELDLVVTNTVPGAYDLLEAILHDTFADDRLPADEAFALGLPNFTEWFQATPCLARIAGASPRGRLAGLRGAR